MFTDFATIGQITEVPMGKTLKKLIWQTLTIKTKSEIKSYKNVCILTLKKMETEHCRQRYNKTKPCLGPQGNTLMKFSLFHLTFTGKVKRTNKQFTQKSNMTGREMDKIFRTALVFSGFLTLTYFSHTSHTSSRTCSFQRTSHQFGDKVVCTFTNVWFSKK